MIPKKPHRLQLQNPDSSACFQEPDILKFRVKHLYSAIGIQARCQILPPSQKEHSGLRSSEINLWHFTCKSQRTLEGEWKENDPIFSRQESEAQTKNPMMSNTRKDHRIQLYAASFLADYAFSFPGNRHYPQASLLMPSANTKPSGEYKGPLLSNNQVV